MTGLSVVNDTDVDGNLDPSSASVVSGPSNATLINNGDGTFTYTPNPDFNGSDHYIYQACDPLGECTAATVSMAVNPVNDPPVAADDAYSTKQDTPLAVNAPGLLSNDHDMDGDSLFVDAYDAVSEFGGAVSVDSYGRLRIDRRISEWFQGCLPDHRAPIIGHEFRGGQVIDMVDVDFGSLDGRLGYRRQPAVDIFAAAGEVGIGRGFGNQVALLPLSK